MTRLKPVSRRELMKRMVQLGFSGPFSGGRHSFMSRGDIDVRIPNPHEGDIGVGVLKRTLEQADISREEWMKQK